MTMTLTAHRPTGSARQLLVDWASRIFEAEGHELTPRIATVRAGDVEEHCLSRDYQLRGLVQAAAVLARSVDTHDLVVALSPAKPPRPIVYIRGAPPTEWAAALDMRSRGGVRALRMHAARRDGRGTARWLRDLPVKAVEYLGDWMAPGFFVDPALEEHLASLGVPGAARRSILLAPSPTTPA